MLLVRGINGKLKLSPAVKMGGGLLLLLTLIAGGLTHRFLEFREKVRACEAVGGVWIGGALPSSFCELAQKKEGEW